jgi:hypothetical protein
MGPKSRRNGECGCEIYESRAAIKSIPNVVIFGCVTEGSLGVYCPVEGLQVLNCHYDEGSLLGSKVKSVCGGLRFLMERSRR